MSIAKRIARTMGPRSIGMATPERASHAPDGIDREILSHNEGHIRARVRAPMQLHAAANNRLAREAAEREGSLRGATKPPADDQPEPRYRLMRLDTRFDLDHSRNPPLGDQSIRRGLHRYRQARHGIGRR